jgi:hypothetical protein
VTDEEFVFGGDATDIPPGTYPGKLAALGKKTSDAFGDFRTWDFTLDTGSVVGGASSMNTGPKSKGGRWAAALNGGVQYKGTSTDLIGKPCLIVVGLDKNDWPVVTDVLPPLAKGAKKAPVIVDAEPRTDDDALPF